MICMAFIRVDGLAIAFEELRKKGPSPSEEFQSLSENFKDTYFEVF